MVSNHSLEHKVALSTYVRYAALAKDSEPFLTVGGSAADLAWECGHVQRASMLWTTEYKDTEKGQLI